MIIKHLIEHGIKPSVQRIAIMEYLLTHKTHPMVDEIYEALVPQLRTLSKTTVYNTLKLYTDAGLILTLNIDDGFLHYDGDTSLHAHFRCSSCGAIHDLAVKSDYSNWFEGSGDFSVTEAQLYLKGLCPKCKSCKN